MYRNIDQLSYGLFAILLCVLSSCTPSDPPGQRTLAKYELKNKKQVRVVYREPKASDKRSILVELTSDGRVDSVLYRFDDYNFMQFSHLQHDSAIIVGIKRDTMVVNLDTYVIPIPQ